MPITVKRHTVIGSGCSSRTSGIAGTTRRCEPTGSSASVNAFSPARTTRTLIGARWNTGKQYIDDGGNGPGHIRYEQLVDDYRRRMEENDWDYSPQNSRV